MRKKLKKRVSLLMSFFMLLSTLTTQVLAAPTDISNHWAKASIEKLIDYGIMQGNEQGKFNPNGLITRAECVTLINRSFNFDKDNNIAFEDVQSGAWYAEEFSKAATQGYIEGDGGKVLPKELVTREEVAQMFSRVLKLSSDETLRYIDQEDKGIFNPKKGMTRAEVATVLDRAIGNLYDTAQVYDEKGKTLVGNVTINSSGVVLENATIKGNLYITEGVGKGEVTLNNVVIEGETIVSGGGMDSIVFISTKAGVVKIEVPDNTPVRLVASGGTAIGEVKAQSESKLEESNLTGEGFGAVTINIPEDAKVSLSGDFDKVDIVSGNAKLDVLEGSIKVLNIEATGKNAQIQLAQGVVVDTMACNGAAKVSGTGTIHTANINVSGVEMAQAPKKIEIKEGITADIKGQIVDKVTSGGSDKDNNTNQDSSDSGDIGNGGSTSKPINTKILELELSNVVPALKFKSDVYVYTTTRSSLYGENMGLSFRTGRNTKVEVTQNNVQVIPSKDGYYVISPDKEEVFIEIVITITEIGNSKNKTVYTITVDTRENGNTSKPIDTKILELELSNVAPVLDFKSDVYTYTTTRSSLYGENMRLSFRTGRSTKAEVTQNNVQVNPDNNGYYTLTFDKTQLFTEIIITITEVGNSENKTVYSITIDNILKNRVEKDSYIYNSSKDVDLKVNIYPKPHTSFENLLLDQKILEKGKDYTIQDNKISLMQEFLTSKQGVGRLNFTICFTQGNDVAFEVLVVDEKPVYLGDLSLIVDTGFEFNMDIPLIQEDGKPIEGKLAFIDMENSEIEFLDSKGVVITNSNGELLKRSFRSLPAGNGRLYSVDTGYMLRWVKMDDFLRDLRIRSNELVPAAIRVKVVKKNVTGEVQVSESVKVLDIPKTEYKPISITITEYNEGNPIVQNYEVDQTKPIQSLKINDFFKVEYNGQGVRSYWKYNTGIGIIQGVGGGYEGISKRMGSSENQPNIQIKEQLVLYEKGIIEKDAMLYEKGKMPFLVHFQLNFTENTFYEDRLITKVSGEVVEDPNYQYVFKVSFGNDKENEISYKDAIEKYYLRPESVYFRRQDWTSERAELQEIEKLKKDLEEDNPEIERIVIETTSSGLTVKIKDIGAFFAIFDIDPEDYTHSSGYYKQWIFSPNQNERLLFHCVSGVGHYNGNGDKGGLIYLWLKRMTAYPTEIKIKNWTKDNTGDEIGTVTLNNEINRDTRYYTDQYKVEITTSSNILTTSSSIDISLEVLGMSDKGVVKYYDKDGYEIATNKIIVTQDLIPGKDYNTWVNVVVTEPGAEMRRYRLNIYRADSK